jgi:transposase
MTLPPPATASAAPTHVQVQVKRGAMVISVDWPLDAVAQFTVWTRELLK